MIKAPGSRESLGMAKATLWHREGARSMRLMIEIERETDGRWIAEIPELPGTIVYGVTRDEALAKVEALALRVLAERLEHGEPVPELTSVFSVAA
jgi:predicted RNase H-like HicB family nuclease